MAMNAKVVLRYEDYAALPDDGKRYEIHEGELSVTPAPGTPHQAVSIRLASALHIHVSTHASGEVFAAPVDVILSDTTIVQPDIVFIAADRSSVVSTRGIEGAPTLVVEILSPWTTATDRRTKMRLYAFHRVPWYWIVDPVTRAIDVYRLTGSAYELAQRFEGDASAALEPLPGLTLSP